MNLSFHLCTKNNYGVVFGHLREAYIFSKIIVPEMATFKHYRSLCFVLCRPYITLSNNYLPVFCGFSFIHQTTVSSASVITF